MKLNKKSTLASDRVISCKPSDPEVTPNGCKCSRTGLKESTDVIDNH